MIKFPDKEFMDNLYDHFYPEMCNEMFKTYNAEILRLNEPAKPEFDEWAKYCAKDDDGNWYVYELRPEYSARIVGQWGLSDMNSDYTIADGNQAKWLEYCNGNRPASESLIFLEDYK